MDERIKLYLLLSTALKNECYENRHENTRNCENLISAVPKAETLSNLNYCKSTFICDDFIMRFTSDKLIRDD